MGLYVKISGGGIICTVLNAIFTVQATDTGMVPAAMVTTVNELVQEIKDAQDSFPADLTNLLAAVAPTFSTSTAYSAGTYVWQGGKLYRFTAAHPAGTWTGTDAAAVALGNDVSDLKSAVDPASVDETTSYMDLSGSGEPADEITVSGNTPTINALKNTMYLCGTVSSISFTPSSEGLSAVRFTSGTTPAVLTVPNTVIWPEWFDPNSLSASTTYEINVHKGVYGVVGTWQ
jgi:hypothetical protein